MKITAALALSGILFFASCVNNNSEGNKNITDDHRSRVFADAKEFLPGWLKIKCHGFNS